jgi:NADH-quinone oxidoreductase subunit F
MQPVLLAARSEPDGRSLLSARRRGIYDAVERARNETPQAVTDMVKRSDLRGRGGAGFPTGLKWQFARDAKPRERYVVCNADESEPGTFKDREIIRTDPHLLLAGLMIACHAVEAGTGVIYIRGEFPTEAEILERAIEEAVKEGYAGGGSGEHPAILLYRGAGAYVCGEETALLNSMEGRRGTPRVRPPFPANAGFLSLPTVVNNVETLACVPWIVARGPEWFASIGRSRNRGPKLYPVSGHVRRPGVYELPLGTSFSELIFEHAGGLRSERRLKAFCPGGVTTPLLPASAVEVAADYEAVAAAGSALGSGALIVVDNSACIVDVARVSLEFMVHESCGTCVPCRIGSTVLLDLTRHVAAGDATETDIERMRTVGRHAKATALCGLGQACQNVLLSALDLFEGEFLAHLGGRRCPVCSAAVAEGAAR